MSSKTSSATAKTPNPDWFEQALASIQYFAGGDDGEEAGDSPEDRFETACVKWERALASGLPGLDGKVSGYRAQAERCLKAVNLGEKAMGKTRQKLIDGVKAKGQPEDLLARMTRALTQSDRLSKRFAKSSKDMTPRLNKLIKTKPAAPAGNGAAKSEYDTPEQRRKFESKGAAALKTLGIDKARLPTIEAALFESTDPVVAIERAAKEAGLKDAKGRDLIAALKKAGAL